MGETGKREQELRQLGAEVLALVESSPLYDRRHPAQRLVEEIVLILDDDSMEDSDCFYRIDAVVRAFQKAGRPTKRHWELD